MRDGIVAIPVGPHPFDQNPIHQPPERRSMVKCGSPQVPGEFLVKGVDEDHESSSSHETSLAASESQAFPLISLPTSPDRSTASTRTLLAVSYL